MFADVSAVADLIVKGGIKYIGAVMFEAGTMEVLNEKALKEACT